MSTLPNLDLLIITAPFTYTFGPSLSPALLKSCVENKNYQVKTWDLSAEFNHSYSEIPNYKTITLWMQHPEIIPDKLAFDWYQSVVKDYAIRIIQQYNPKNLAISLLTQSSQRFVEDCCFYIRSLAPSIKIILGGNSLDILQFQFQKSWGQLMIDSQMADCILIGEGEYALVEILDDNFYGIKKVNQLTNQELDQIPVPNYDDYDMTLYPVTDRTFWSTSAGVRSIDSGPVFLITSSKGCIKNCTFCDVGSIWSRFRFRSGESVANEIYQLHKKYNARFFSFTDSLMNGGLRPFYDMNVALIEKLKGAIKYEGQMICRGKKEMPEKYFEIMSQGGCASVTIGIESGSEKVRKDMGKGSSNADIAYSTEMFTRYGIKQAWNIVAGYPTETNKDWQDTIDLVAHWLPKSNGLLMIVPIDTFLVLPGTPMTETELYHSLELSQENINGYSEFAWISGKNPTNTYDVRAARFIELCNLVHKFSNNDEYRRRIQNKIESTNKKLEWYYANKQRKIFSLHTA